MVARILSAVAVATCLSSAAPAALTSAKHPVHGVGALTHDTTQRLDFPDLTFIEGRSRADVTGKFGAGQEFEGFRTALESEVFNPILNAGFTPDPAPGSLVNYDQEDDCHSTLVDLLGPTRTTSLVRTTDGHTGCSSGTEFPANFRTAIVDSSPRTADIDARFTCMYTPGSTAGVGIQLAHPFPALKFAPFALCRMDAVALLAGSARRRANTVSLKFSNRPRSPKFTGTGPPSESGLPR